MVGADGRRHPPRQLRGASRREDLHRRARSRRRNELHRRRRARDRAAFAGSLRDPLRRCGRQACRTAGPQRARRYLGRRHRHARDVQRRRSAHAHDHPHRVGLHGRVGREGALWLGRGARQARLRGRRRHDGHSCGRPRDRDHAHVQRTARARLPSAHEPGAREEVVGSASVRRGERDRRVPRRGTLPLRAERTEWRGGVLG